MWGRRRPVSRRRLGSEVTVTESIAVSRGGEVWSSEAAVPAPRNAVAEAVLNYRVSDINVIVCVVDDNNIPVVVNAAAIA